jgi:hypothetical protein
MVISWRADSLRVAVSPEYQQIRPLNYVASFEFRRGQRQKFLQIVLKTQLCVPIILKSPTLTEHVTPTWDRGLETSVRKTSNLGSFGGEM